MRLGFSQHCLLGGIFCCLLVGCSGSARVTPVAAELDYTEIANATGWILRIYGNGSGSISHEQLPAYHLHYPCSTFSTLHLRPRPLHCSTNNQANACTRVTRYSAYENLTSVCACAGSEWTEELMIVAIDQMEYAIEAGGSERSCRMLRRRWLGVQH
ncbi:hypothetical protein [Neolewinella antarctica]|uniref:Uncharacterized protein n=1 Tax=Neolewinella antarctica TaxID=442734 RepID=A0ABX0XD94_9BACT|nr:hypothetical protein [Neolewinella antarctica]NJC27279.1 hypothetical protein [Neolewinella antarctica]